MTALKHEVSASYSTPLNVVVGIIAISALASAFLFWLVYKHPPTDVAGTHLLFLPALNALLNLCCTVALLFGFRYIWRGQVTEHRNSMFTAFVFSSLFLVCYITNYFLHGDTIFPVSHPTARFLYLWVLLTPHVVAATVALPMILITFFFALTGRFQMHRRIAQYTFPIWLYVSVSGVVVYAMLAIYR